MKNLLLLHEPYICYPTQGNSYLNPALFFRYPGRIGYFYVRLFEDRIYLADSLLGEVAEVGAENIPGREFAKIRMRLQDRCPTWPEMVALNHLLFLPDEPTFEVHPRKKDYVNNEAHTLHIWKPKNDDWSYMILQEMKWLVQQVLSSFAGKTVHSEREVSQGEFWGKRYISIWGGDTWPTWEEVCQIKKQEIGEDVTALQFHISRELDLNSQRVLLLWYADDINVKLPPKELV